MLTINNTLDGYLKDVEIKGNTIQDTSNLADIRSVGDKVEGQELYEIPVVSCGKNLFDGIISNIVKSLEQGKHVAIALSDFDIVVDGFEERINNNHVMSIASVLDNGLLEVDSWGKKCYIDLKNVTKSAIQITISELSLNEK